MIGVGKSLLSIKKNHGSLLIIFRMVVFNIRFRSRTGERGDQFLCMDDNECIDGNNYCVDEGKGGICVNIDGSFTCTCKTGYTGAPLQQMPMVFHLSRLFPFRSPKYVTRTSPFIRSIRQMLLAVILVVQHLKLLLN